MTTSLKPVDAVRPALRFVRGMRLVTFVLLLPAWLVLAPLILIGAAEEPGLLPMPAPGLSPAVWLAMVLVFYAPPLLMIASLLSMAMEWRKRT